MKISELSEQSGVPLPTIKFYLREGLLPAGTLTRPNQATYDDGHLRRLRLIRALRETGGLGLATIRELCAAIDHRGHSMLELMGAVADAMGETTRPMRPDDAAHARAAEDVDEFLRSRELPVRHGSTARDNLIDALVAFRGFSGDGMPASAFDPYLEAVRTLAEWEAGMAMTAVGEPFDDAKVEDTIEFMVYGTVLAEPVLLSLRRLVHERIAHLAAKQEIPGSG